MKRLEYVYHQSLGVMLVMSFPNPNDKTLAVVFYKTREGYYDTKILSDNDAVPIETDEVLEEMRSFLKKHGKPNE